MKDFKTKGKRQKTKFEPRRRGLEDRKSIERKPFERKTIERKPIEEAAYKPQTPSLIYGFLPVLESLRANSRRIEKILIADGGREHRISEIMDLARENHIQFQKVPRESLTKLVEPGANHQGVIAFTASADYADTDKLLTEIIAKQNSLTLILDGVEDPRNLGAILRVAECAGVDGTFIPEHRAVGLNETVVKTSAGATEYTKIAKVKNLNRLIEELKKNNIWVVGTSGDAEKNYADWDWKSSCALVLGGEGKGLHRLVAENCDELVKIPMQGKIESLNVSVAAGVILFEAVRQKVSSSKFQVSSEEIET